MGRGISKLQRGIIRLAKPDSIGRMTTNIDDVLIHLFGWKLTKYKTHPQHRREQEAFNKDKIGAAKYNRVHATISRASKRLQERGLVLHGGRIIPLTAEGKKLKDKLDADGGGAK